MWSSVRDPQPLSRGYGRTQQVPGAARVLVHDLGSSPRSPNRRILRLPNRSYILPAWRYVLYRRRT